MSLVHTYTLSAHMGLSVMHKLHDTYGTLQRASKLGSLGIRSRRLELPAVAAEQLHLLNRCAPGTAALGTDVAVTGFP